MSTTRVEVCKDCGFGAISKDGHGRYVCVICGCRQKRETKRKSWKCVHCGRETSTPTMIVDAKKGLHYDGCKGWE